MFRQHLTKPTISQTYKKLKQIIFKRSYLIPQSPFPPKTPLLTMVHHIQKINKNNKQTKQNLQKQKYFTQIIEPNLQNKIPTYKIIKQNYINQYNQYLIKKYKYLQKYTYPVELQSNIKTQTKFIVKYYKNLMNQIKIRPNCYNLLPQVNIFLQQYHIQKNEQKDKDSFQNKSQQQKQKILDQYNKIHKIPVKQSSYQKEQMYQIYVIKKYKRLQFLHMNHMQERRLMQIKNDCTSYNKAIRQKLISPIEFQDLDQMEQFFNNLSLKQKNVVVSDKS